MTESQIIKLLPSRLSHMTFGVFFSVLKGTVLNFSGQGFVQPEGNVAKCETFTNVHDFHVNKNNMCTLVPCPWCIQGIFQCSGISPLSS